MPVGYRAIFAVRDAVAVAETRFRSWLGTQGYDPGAAVPGVHVLGGSVPLAVTERPAADGSRTLRYRLAEHLRAGEWNVTLTAHEPGPEGREPGPEGREPGPEGRAGLNGPVGRDVQAGLNGHAGHGRYARSGPGEAGGWIWLDVSAPPARPAPPARAAMSARVAMSARAAAPGPAGMPGLTWAPGPPGRADDGWTEVPPLVRDILAVAPARDGEMPLRAGVELVTAGTLDHLRSVICDDRRRGAAIVAAPIQRVNPGSFRARVRHLTAECVGLAGLFMLDERAAALLRADWSPTHDVKAGTIRVFLPGADPASGDDARRHRVLPAGMILAEDPGMLARYLGTACRRQATELPLPAHVAAVNRILEQAEQAALREAVAPREAEQAAVPASGDAEAPRPDAGPNCGTSSVVAGLRDQVDELAESLRQARKSLEGEQLENAVMQEDLLKAKAAVERLRARLPAAGRLGDDAGDALPRYPHSFAELLDWIRDRRLPRVVFTGKPDEALALDDHNPLGAWAGKTWEILRVLDGYAELRSKDKFGQGVHAYLERTPAGRPGYSVHAHAAQESDLVSKTPKYRNHRVRPVPSEVSPDGMIYMPAHFKITQHGLISPRLYYYDDATGTGKIYVGYIGKHLPNFHTN